MAISEVCQFELKEEVDKLKNDNPGLSLAECIRKTIEFYADAGVEVKEATAKKKYQRATKSMGTNVPTSATSQNHMENKENKEISKGFTADGKPRQRVEGAGRKPKYIHTETHMVSDAMDLATMAISQLKRINLNDPHREDALNEVEQWIFKNRRKN